MPRGNYRKPYVAPFDPTITQKIENALRDAGRDDLVDALRKAGMRELEENLHKAEERLHALELEKKNWLTESGMFLALENKTAKVAVGWGKRALQAAAGAAGLGLVSLFIWILKLAWIGYKK